LPVAEKGLDNESHLIDLHAGENATEEYQRIHPKGLELIGWPLQRYANLMRCSLRVQERPSYQVGLMDWEPTGFTKMLKPKQQERVRVGDGPETYIPDS
jgi:hypothetical protein